MATMFSAEDQLVIEHKHIIFFVSYRIICTQI